MTLYKTLFRKLFGSNRDIFNLIIDIIFIIIVLMALGYVKECPCAFKVTECCDCPRIPTLEKFNQNSNDSINIYHYNVSEELALSELNP